MKGYLCMILLPLETNVIPLSQMTTEDVEMTKVSFQKKQCGF